MYNSIYNYYYKIFFKLNLYNIFKKAKKLSQKKPKKQNFAFWAFLKLERESDIKNKPLKKFIFFYFIFIFINYI